MRNGLAATAAIATAAALLAGCAAGGVRERQFAATLTGYQAVPGPGDLDGTGRAEFRIAPGGGELCWQLNVRDIGPAVSAGLYRGQAGSAGEEVLGLPLPGPDGSTEGCAAVADETMAQLSGYPHLFHVAVATAEHPGGAIRGQLRGRRAIEPRRVRDR